jgi:DNA-binding NarL/FixJ family response regulator
MMAQSKDLWSHEDERRLLQMLEDGASVLDIAWELNRSQEAVSARQVRIKAEADFEAR